MPRVLPSEVVRVIEALFPGHIENDFQSILLVAANLSGLEVISELVEQIPEANMPRGDVHTNSVENV